MTTKAKKVVKITSIVLAAILLVCVIMAAIVLLPQFRKKGTRYESTREIENGSVQMIAHRGLSGLKLENTVEAFTEAGLHSYYGIETDVRVTGDGKFILFHDDDLSRIAGLDTKIAETPFEELRALRFDDPYGESENVYYLPTMEEYYAVCKAFDKQAILELKGDMTADQVKQIADIVVAEGWFERTTFISFSRELLLYLRAAYPTAEAQYIVQYCKQEDVDFMIEHKIDANLCFISVTPSRVRALHKAGRKVNCWTIDGATCAWYMKLCGVDFITTNVLE
ncbi:MAG: hypothetical protein IJV80_04405 [Clostridia bacterium]|nr:hypothetical protein [Clostridia bacterium]